MIPGAIPTVLSLEMGISAISIFGVSARMKWKQILDAFQDEIDPETYKMVCAPCSNCKGGIRDLLEYYEGWDKTGIAYTGLVEFIVNAMVDIEEPFIEWPEF